MNKYLITTLLFLSLFLPVNFAAEDKPIFKAIRAGDVAKVTKMIKADKKLLKSLSRRTKHMPIHFAAKFGKPEVAKALLELGADPNKNDKSSISGKSPLYYAIGFKNLDIAEMLIKEGAHVYERNDAGNLFILATRLKLYDLAKKLFSMHKFNLNEKGKSAEYTALHAAAADGNFEFVKFLVENGANANIYGENNKTPLHFAAENNHYEVAKFLIENGAKPNVYELESLARHSSYAGNYDRKFTYSPLHYAAQKSDLKMVKLLVEAGAHVNAAAYGETTPLHHAAHRGADDMVKYLVEKGADINKRGKISKDTPLKCAIAQKQKSTIQLIKSLGGVK
ncbi:MAG: ankyrin repeat domain-containing protein [Candidatus Rifleibacteriota bacterium]